MEHVGVSDDILGPIQGSEYYRLVMLRHVSEVMLSVCVIFTWSCIGVSCMCFKNFQKFLFFRLFSNLKDIS